MFRYTQSSCRLPFRHFAYIPPPSHLQTPTRQHTSSGTKAIGREAEPTKASEGEVEPADKGDGQSIELEKTKASAAPGVVRDVGSEILHLRRVNEALCERVEYMERCQLGSLVRQIIT